MAQVSSAPLLLLIDGSHAVFRSFFAIRHLTSPAGLPTGAVFGFSSMLLKLLREYSPQRIAVCFDTSGPTWRHDLSQAYKANRPDMPEELQVQWPICQRIAQELGLPVLNLAGQEADDLIATLAHRGQAAGFQVLIVSGDKDLMQLVDDAGNGRPPIRQLDDGKGQIYNEAGVAEKWGVSPKQVGDLLSIMGDSVDNIAGVRGIGEKGAAKLLQQWGTLDNIWANLDQVQPPRAQELLRMGKETAELAKRLVKLEHEVNLQWSLDDLQPQPAQRVLLAQSFGELGFRRLTADYLDAAPAAEVSVQVDIATAADLPPLAEAMAAAGQLALWAVTDLADPERTRPRYGRLVGLALATTPERAWYLPIDHAMELDSPANLPLALVQQHLGPLLADPAIGKLGSGIKYELLVLRAAGLPVAGLRGDAMLASYLYEPEAHNHDLKAIVQAVLASPMPADDAALGKGKAQLGWDGVTAAAAAAVLGQRPCWILKACQALEPKLAQVQVDPLYRDLELPLSQVLADMEYRGIGLDVDELARQSAWLAGEIEGLQQEIWQLSGETFNIGSPAQLGRVLFESLHLPAKKKTQSGWSTDQSVLEGLQDKHPVAAKVLRWRQLTKLRSTYTEMLPQMVLAQTGRIHTWFHQAVAATGRLSSIDPNLQNIPIRSTEGRRIRSAFVASPGRVLVSADYSQIELRVMAHLANDPGLQEAFAKGADIHRETAARMFNLLPDLVSPAERSAAKTINFGILYGMGPQRLSREIGVSLKEAKGFIDKYFERFPAVHLWMESVLADARSSGEVRTLFGRRRPVPGVNSANQADRAAAERVAINTPVQGTAADLIKRAMLLVQGELANAGLCADLLLQVHDELVLECALADAPAVAAAVRAAMEKAGRTADGAELKVPLQVEVHWGHSWAEAH